MTEASAQAAQVADGGSAQQSTESSTAAVTPSSTGEGLKCEWQGCTTRLSNAEALYDHVCENHVGRKSTNNLNLTCAWGNCRTTTVKRDHITSHIRVHVPLKPHKCDYCQKAFKRPQDLKKHVKTHAEDPNYGPGPESSRGHHQHHHHQNGPGVFGGATRHLQHMAASAQGYYPDQHMPTAGASMYQGYANGGAPTPAAYHHASGNQYQASNYMTTAAVYPVNQSSSSAHQEYELRKRATFDALNEFFGDLKSRQIDTAAYNAIGNRLMNLQPVTGYVGGGDSGGGGGSTSAATATHPAGHGPGHQYYSLPQLRTKHDLLDADRLLDQLQSTVYEGGVINTLPIHTGNPGVTVTSRPSPPRGSAASSMSAASGLGGIPMSNTLPPISISASLDTPALTPASSEMSYNSPQSSAVDRVSLSPTNRPGLPLYPVVHDSHSHHQHHNPYTSAMSTSSLVSSAHATAMPSGTSHYSYDHHNHRNYSAGELQRARPSSNEGSSPRDGARSVSSDDESLPQIGRLGVHSPPVSYVDPALWDSSSRRSKDSGSSGRGSTTPTQLSREDADESDISGRDPNWIDKVRVLESLKAYVKHRLDNELWESSSEEGNKRENTSSSNVREVEHKVNDDSSDVDMEEEEERSLYPVIPT